MDFQSFNCRSCTANEVLSILRMAGVIVALLTALLDSMASSTAVTNLTTYAVKGVFVESRSRGRTAVIAHEEIPGYMSAMSMPFNVKKPAELKGLQPGDQITFRLSVTGDEDWIDEIKRVGKGAGRGAPAVAQLEAGARLGRGALLPDFTLTNQAGEIIHTASFGGQALAFTFFFSRCPLPSFCPRMNNNFHAVQQTLKADTTRNNWQLLSISFDPGFDTPEFLAEFARYQQADPRHWSFATSSVEQLRELGSAVGMNFWEEKGTISHNLRTVVVDASGRVEKIFTGNDWRPGELVKAMRKAMGVKP